MQPGYKPIDPNAMAGTPPKDLFANALGAHAADGQNSQAGLSPGNSSQVSVSVLNIVDTTPVMIE